MKRFMSFFTGCPSQRSWGDGSSPAADGPRVAEAGAGDTPDAADWNARVLEGCTVLITSYAGETDWRRARDGDWLF